MPDNPLSSRKAFRHAADLLMRDLGRRGLPVGFPAALDILSGACGSDWNVMSAFLKDAATQGSAVSATRPTATAGDSHPSFGDILDPVTWKYFLRWAWECRASVGDIRIRVGAPVQCAMRDGGIRTVVPGTMSDMDMLGLVRHALGADAEGALEAGRSLDIVSFGEAGRAGRFRARIAVTSGPFGPQIDVALMPVEPPLIGDLGVEAAILESVRLGHRGLTLIGGNPGSGKSNLIAALVRWHCEDVASRASVWDFSAPLEYLYDRLDLSTSSVSQAPREDVASAVLSAARLAASVIVVNEPRTGKDVDTCCLAAISGTSVITSVSASGVAEILHRMAGLTSLRDGTVRCLNLVVAQCLLPCVQGGRIAVREYLSFDDALRDRLVATPTKLWPIVVAEALKEDAATARGRSMRVAAEELRLAGRISERDLRRVPPPLRSAEELLGAGIVSEAEFLNLRQTSR